MDGLHQIGPADHRHFLGVLYAEDFDVPKPEAPPEPEPEVSTFSKADLAEAQVAAAQDAIRDARQAWDNEAAASRALALDRIAAALSSAGSAARSVAEEVASEAAKTMLALLASLMPHLCRLHGDCEVQALLRHLLPQLAAEPRIAVRVHPAVLDAVRDDLRTLDPDLAAAVSVSALDTLGRGDARVAWRNGSLHRDAGAMASALHAGLAELGLLEPQTAPTVKRMEPCPLT